MERFYPGGQQVIRMIDLYLTVRYRGYRLLERLGGGDAKIHALTGLDPQRSWVVEPTFPGEDFGTFLDHPDLLEPGERVSVITSMLDIQIWFDREMRIEDGGVINQLDREKKCSLLGKRRGDLTVWMLISFKE